MNPRIVIVVALAFAAGTLIGYRSGRSESRVETVQAAMTAAPARPSPAAASGAMTTGGEPNGAPGAAPGQALTASESQAVAGLLALRSGDYAGAVPFLEAAAEGIDAPELTAFRATALEGAGQGQAAERLLKTDAEIEAVRTIARDAFMQHQDFMIAGPAYQLYLRLRPNAAQAPMMKQAIDMWERKKRGEPTG